MSAQSSFERPFPAESSRIYAKDLVKTYPNGVRALDGFSCLIQQGEIYGLLGPNGAGKSTAVRILTTLSRATSGSARVCGIDVTTEPNRVRQLIGVVSQKSSVDLDATGRENLMLQGRIHGIAGRQLASRVGALLEMLNLASSADRIARTYSGGMARKLDVAMGLIHEPQILFLDEPTTGLDPDARAGLLGDISRLTATGSMTVLLTTHYLDEVEKLAHRCGIVDRGRMIAQGTPADLKAQLHGDAIHAELQEAAGGEGIEDTLARIPGIRDVTVLGRSVRARADNAPTAVPTVLAALDAGGWHVSSVTISRPTLEDVYFRHTGRTFDQTETGV